MIGTTRQLMHQSATVALLIAAVILTPWPLASVLTSAAYDGPTALGSAVSAGFVHDWATGGSALGAPSSALAEPVRFWQMFHVIKAAESAPLLVSALLLLRLLWSTLADESGRWRRPAVAAGGLVGSAVAFLALLVLVANIQGALTPLSSVLGFLPLDGREPRLAETVAAVSTAVTSGTDGPVRDSLLGDFTRYHAAMTGLGGVATVALATATTAGWRWRRTIRPAPRRLRAAATLALCGLALGTLFFAMVTAANVSTLTLPTPAITGFLHGSS